MKTLALSLFLAFCLTASAHAEPPRVIDAVAMRVGMGWRIDVTLEHPDTGWDHYADGWRIEDEAGNVIGLRELMHPHVNEQPFTRALLNVMFPDGMEAIWIRARCSADGWAENRYKVVIPR